MVGVITLCVRKWDTDEAKKRKTSHVTPAGKKDCRVRSATEEDAAIKSTLRGSAPNGILEHLSRPVQRFVGLKTMRRVLQTDS